MKIDLTRAPEVQTFEVAGRTILVGAVKGKHMVRAQAEGGAKAGSVELGYRTLASAIKETMGEDAPTYAELLDLSVADAAPLLALING